MQQLLMIKSNKFADKSTSALVLMETLKHYCEETTCNENNDSGFRGGKLEQSTGLIIRSSITGKKCYEFDRQYGA